MRETKMTRKMALAEAMRRWGCDLCTPWVRWFRDRNKRFFQVGYDHITHGRFRCGIGASWEEAFADSVSPSGATHE